MNKSGLVRQWTAACTASLSVFVLGAALGWASPVLLAIEKTGDEPIRQYETPVNTINWNPLTLNKDQISWMVSLIYLGNLMSPIPAGWMMDKVGRKSSLLILAVFPLTSWIIIYFATAAWHLHLARFFAGTWSGVVSTVVPMYLAEISQPKIRGALSTLIQLMTNIGVVFEYLIGPFVSYKTLAAISFSFPLIFLVSFSFMPESPYWLLSKNRTAAAGKSLAWLRGYSATDVLVLDELEVLEQNIAEDMNNVKSFRDLFASRGNRNGLLIVEVLAIVQRMSGISALMAYTAITLPNRNILYMDVNGCVILMGSIWVVSVFIATFLVDKLGRKPLLLVSCLGCSVAMFTAGLWFFLDTKTTIDVSDWYWTPIASFIVYGVFFSIGLGPIASTVQGEYFPTNIKGLASGVTSIVLAATSFVTNKIYYVIAHSAGMYLNYWIFSGASFVGAFFVYFVVIETKGKTFNEIQEKLNRRSSRQNLKYSPANQ